MKKENIPQYVKYKYNALINSKYSFESLFNIINDQEDRIFCEYIENFLIKNVTYKDFEIYTKRFATFIKNNLSFNKDEFVGLLMDNSINWVAAFWSILMLGGKPLLLNKKLPLSINKEVIKNLNVTSIISDIRLDDSFKNVLVIDNKNKILENINSLKELKEFNWADEIALTTTATTLNYKICIYNGKDFTNEVLNVKGILANNKNVKEHYEHRLKLLAFLPFYHIFGLTATYFWFALYGRTFIFLHDYSSETILNTIKRHKVTHIFAVPLFWNTIVKEIKKKINKLENKEKALKGIKFAYNLQNLSPTIGRHRLNKILKEVQSNIFGDSVLFTITGGGSIPNETLYYMNAIGYPLYNGYGSTEINITSVELREKPKYRIKGSIGKPFDSVEYKIEDNELLIKGTSLCSKMIYKDGKEEIIDKNKWYHTNDLAKVDKDGYYYLLGRKDDVFIGENGENINPDVLEKEVLLTSVIRYVFTNLDNKLCLIIQISKANFELKRKHIIEEINECLSKLTKLGYSINKIYFTFDDIASKEAIKVSRTILNKLINEKKINLVDFKELENIKNEKLQDLDNSIIERIKKVFAEVLNKETKDIGIDDHFFFTLGGSSLDYMTLLIKLEQEFDTSITFKDVSCSTVKEFYKYLMKEGN